jgi:hypothetical protein
MLSRRQYELGVRTTCLPRMAMSPVSSDADAMKRAFENEKNKRYRRCSQDAGADNSVVGSMRSHLRQQRAKMNVIFMMKMAPLSERGNCQGILYYNGNREQFAWYRSQYPSKSEATAAGSTTTYIRVNISRNLKSIRPKP